MFERIDYYAGDPILGLVDKFVADSNPNKMNLGIGIYNDEVGKMPVLDCVKTAEQRIANPIPPRPYLPMAGLPGHHKGCQDLLFGKGAQALTDGRVATLGGSGALVDYVANAIAAVLKG